MNSFRITGLAPNLFAHLFGLDNAALDGYGVKRFVVDEKPGFPDRIAMRDLEVGESALLLNYVHQPADTPYRASHAIFIGEAAAKRYEAVNVIPEVLRLRQLSLRAFDVEHMMVDAELVPGTEAESIIDRMLSNPRVEYIHIHYAKRGCFAGRADRA